ncbi:tetratricopeptide repeat protein [Bradyrhizobium erythrophlei]|jgi:tetratricopeptide (TPR) repeat protein|uniref:Tetratricopeptide (TPR) repeat n=1 Tax=Bradyrhizobium erythrophlei TaxID=1437360 RepID=A0A1M5NHW8_9BRAD|nr:tetratricopeptide repeat-containing glycosyltransferase family protein [Bradyrhizobium erythrophlei]SHG88543.1 Tetratricopeptide (TPR) repeat [Bradyrhizobium erythrophlei]
MNRKQRRAAAKFGRASNNSLEETAAAAAVTPGAAELLQTGLKHQQAGRLTEAEACYRRVLAAHPDHADALHLLGVIAHQVGRRDLAVELIGQAIKQNGHNPVYFSNLGVVLKDQGKLDEAMTAYRQAIRLRPDYAEAYSNLGYALWDQGKLDEAVAACRQAIRFNPGLAEAHSNLGIALKGRGRLDEAVAAAREAIRIRPDFADAHSNLGIALKDQGKLEEAIAACRQAIRFNPDFADAHWNESLLSLLTGDFERGWAKSEWRWKSGSSGLSRRNFTQPLWLGAETLDRQSILLHSEQGLGDTIQFCRYAPLVAARGARVILEVQEPLRELMSGLAGVSHCVSKGEALPDFDLHCPLLSLPLAFGTRLDTIPSTTPYLCAPVHGQDWEARLGPKDRTRIGLVWSGNPAHRDDRKRSIELNALSPLFDVAATFVSLQKDLRVGDEAALTERSNIINLGQSLESFADTAALISHLDLVISVDTSVAHLAGALGRPVWVLLPFVPDWRWLLGRDDSPWYPTARLFRQADTCDWRGVVDRVRTALHDLVENKRADPVLYLTANIPR